MPDYGDVLAILRQGKHPALAHGSSARNAELSRVVNKDRGRSALEGAFYWLDQPGAFIRNLVEGFADYRKFGSAIENVGHFATMGLLEAEPEDVPDWGVLGNIASEIPFYLLTGGAGGGARAAASASKPLLAAAARATTGAARSGLVRQASRAGTQAAAKFLTPFGRRVVGSRATKLAGKRSAMEAATVSKLKPSLGQMPAYLRAGGDDVVEAAVKRAQKKAAARGLSKEATERVVKSIREGAGSMADEGAAFMRRGAPSRPGIGKITTPATRARTVAQNRVLERALGGHGLGPKARTILDQGGLKLGLPFGGRKIPGVGRIPQARTVAFAGKPVNFLAVSPFYWAFKYAGGAMTKSKAGREILSGLNRTVGKLQLLPGASDDAKRLAGIRNAEIEMGKTNLKKWVVDHLDEFTEEELKDFGQSLYGVDVNKSGVTSPEAFRAKYPQRVAAYDKALAGWDDLASKMLAAERDHGILMGDVPDALKQSRLAKQHPEKAAALKEWNTLAEAQLEAGLKKTGTLDTPTSRKAAREALLTTRIPKEEWVARETAKIQTRMDELAKTKTGSAVEWYQSPDGQEWMQLHKVRDDLPKTYDRAREVVASLGDDAAEVLEHGPRQLAGPVERGPYLPQQYTDEALDAMEEANWRAQHLDNTRDPFAPGRGEPAGGARAGHSFAERRKLEKPADFVEWLNEQMDTAARTGAAIPADARPEMNFLKLLTKRHNAHTRAVANARMKRAANIALGGPKGLRAGTRGTREYLEALKKGGLIDDVELVDRAFSDWIRAGAGRLSERGTIGKALAWWNKKLFKPYVTIGIGPVPNPAFQVRNTISGIWQVGVHENIGLAAGVRHTAELLHQAIRKIPVIGKRVRPSQLELVLSGKARAGKIVRGLEKLQIDEVQLEKLLREHGVIGEEFVTAEGLYQAVKAHSSEFKVLPNLRKTKGWQTFVKYTVGTDIPARTAKAIEQRMRTTAFIAAFEKTGDAGAAARAVKEALIDYGIVSDAHRAIRDIVPFAQFTIGQTPRTLKTLAHNPRAFAPLRAALDAGDSGMVLPPFVSEQPHVPLGRDREGNRAYLAGLGTPFEDMNKFWAGDLQRTLQRGVASSHPLIKLLGEEATGKDLFFGSEQGSYRRDVPVARGLPDWLVGRKTRTITDPKTGKKKQISEVSPSFLRFMQNTPISRQLSMANQMFDWRKTTWHKSISLLTGVKVVSVDEDRELRKLIADHLKQAAKNGDIGQFQRFFARGDVEPELALLIHAYYGERKSRRDQK